MKCKNCPVSGPCYADHPSRGRLCRLIADGRDDYRRLVVERSVGLTESPSETLRGPRPRPGRRVVARTFLNSFSGFGRFAWKILAALERQGVAVAIDPSASDDRYGDVDPWLWSHAEPGAPEPWRLSMGYLGGGLDAGAAAVAFTMHETSRPPGYMVAGLNRAHAVIVPSRWNADAFREAGVVWPIHVCPLGHDPAEGWAPAPRELGPFRVLMLGMLASGGMRKGFDRGIAAFLRAFEGRRDVELVVKCWPSCLRHLPALPMDPRIRVRGEALDVPDLVKLVQSADVTLFPTAGEGWNLPALESMACGVPIVATTATAHSAFHDATTGYVAEHVAEPARGYYAGHGDWYPPDVDSLAACLRRAYERPDERRALGVAARERASGMTWDASAATLAKVLRSVGLLEHPDADKWRANLSASARVRSCPHREPCGCARARCSKHGGFKTYQDCTSCPDLPTDASN